MMKKMSRKNLSIAHEYIKSHCEDLHTALFEYHVLKGDPNNVLNALRTYQNDDGGFGHGLEPDFTLAHSSPMATTIAFQILHDIEVTDSSIITKAVQYYESTFDKHRPGWWSVPIEVNDSPHAPWWHYNAEEQCTVIDTHWGNPSSEIIGILYKYREYVKTVDVVELIHHAVRHLNTLSEFTSEHEIYCYLRMYEQLPQHYQEQLREKLSSATQELICLDEQKWNSYVPKPFDFIQSQKHPLFAEIAEHAEKHCDYLIDTVENGVWSPTWKWNQYETDWEQSKRHWTAFLTIKYYRILEEFHRIE